jgi:hypothetical protein
MINTDEILTTPKIPILQQKNNRHGASNSMAKMLNIKNSKPSCEHGWTYALDCMHDAGLTNRE